MQTTYLSSADTAKLVRAALKRTFPGVKFSVRSKTYSMGASIHVAWNGGPTKEAVRLVTCHYHCARFDCLTDMQIRSGCWLLPDGTTIPEWSGLPHPDAKLVQFGADYIIPQRNAL